MNAYLMITAAEPYDPDRSIQKVHIDNKNTFSKEDRFFAVVSSPLWHRKEDLSIRIMDEAELPALDDMTVAKELFCFVKVTMLMAEAVIPVACGSGNRLNKCNTTRFYRLHFHLALPGSSVCSCPSHLSGSVITI